MQSKVKRLKEERERSLSGETTPAFKDERETGNESPEEAGGENGLSGEASARSCKESNSSDLKPPPGHDSGGAAADGDAEVKDEPAAGEMAAKDEASGESAAGSKEADAVKESSDVQSSASPSRKRRRRLRKVGGGDVASTSAPVPLPAAVAEPLLAFLQSVRTSKSGAVFERRLESQVKNFSRFLFFSRKKSLIYHFPPSLPSVKKRHKCSIHHLVQLNNYLH